MVTKNTTDDFEKYGAMHLTKVLPQTLLRRLRKQIGKCLSKDSKRLGIDRCAVAVHQQSPQDFYQLTQELYKSKTLYELVLHQKIGDLLKIHKGWPQAALSPIFNLRSKMPWSISQNPFTNVPWHQDYGASDPNSGEIDLVTAWIPLTAANTHHGGLELIPKSNHLGWLPHHRTKNGPEVIEEELIKTLNKQRNLKPIYIQAMPGDLVLFDQLTLHRSLPNNSNRCRWSIDVRYASAGSNTGRPGLWSVDPLVGEPISSKVLLNIYERLEALSNPALIINKRVDFEGNIERN